MKIDKYYSVSEERVFELAKMTKKALYDHLWSLPIHKGIAVSIREKKIKSLTNDIKQLKPKPSKAKSSRNSGANSGDNPKGQPDKAGED